MSGVLAPWAIVGRLGYPDSSSSPSSYMRVGPRRATALKSGDGLAGQAEQANGHAYVASESGRRRSAA